MEECDKLSEIRFVECERETERERPARRVVLALSLPLGLSICHSRILLQGALLCSSAPLLLCSCALLASLSFIYDSCLTVFPIWTLDHIRK